jgi:hypothetical protein
MRRTRIKLLLVAAGIAVLLVAVLPSAVRFVSVRIYSLDTSDIRGSVLFGGYFPEKPGGYGIWRLHPATGEQEPFFLSDGLLPEYETIESFAYSPERGVLLVSTAKTHDREDGLVAYRLFAKDKRSGAFRLAAESDYTTSVYEHCETYCIEALSLFAVLRGNGIDFLNPEDGKVENRTELNFKPRAMDRNDDFTRVVFDTGKGPVLFDAKNGSEKTLRNARAHSPVFTSDFNEIAFYEFYDPAIRKRDIETGREEVLCDMKDFSNAAVCGLAVSPDRKHAAVLCGGISFMSKGEDISKLEYMSYGKFIVLIEIETGEKALVFEREDERIAFSKMQWIAE